MGVSPAEGVAEKPAALERGGDFPLLPMLPASLFPIPFEFGIAVAFPALPGKEIHRNIVKGVAQRDAVQRPCLF
jgi:hypothetical protein